ncbi:glutamine synthetase family protein [Paracoccus sp. PS-1]|uniref:glutamine synthetase family protein n=1 Tax=unclassified Paracoccus (in: a-proteobacteria) TaxID=2688777 RepID=UPI00048C002C|nr:MULTISPECIES: glutamine synthetase family protein [unclassified Paracoccus (in: a-proteobacteria)]MDQ7260612.1 glutamine synthetase family protein [Paracoccus sp. PS1]
MPANLTFEALETAVLSGEIDTVIVALADMQGRLMGKRFHAAHFLENPGETHCCNYLLATDLEMATVQGYRATGWAAGYGDYALKPDLSTLRRLPWAPGTALCMADPCDHDGHQPVPHAPRNILRRQIARAAALGFQPMMATELEFFLFEGDYRQLHDAGYRGLVPTARHNIDYALTGTAADEPVMRALRNGLHGAGIPVENSKGEAEAGQHEINVRYSDALDTADMHVLVKAATKEIAQAHGRSATFMAKYAHGRAGSSSHVHQSLFRDGLNAFHDPGAEHGMSALMRHYLAGQLAHAGALTYFLAPYVNSYKRFVTGLFAPTRAVWALDNRTAGFRVCGAGSGAIRIECRIGGADLNPYLACAALLAAGLDGVERQLELGPAFAGDAYAARDLPGVPRTLGDAARALDASAMLRAAFGDAVIEHYLHAAAWELEEQNRVVTDWELARGFERA